MGNITSIADYQKSFAAMLAGAEANADELAGTEEVRGGLTAAALDVQVALNRQNSLKGQAQQATRDLEDALDRGKQMYSRLRSGVYMHFGQQAEKLAEFGLHPRRPPAKVKPVLPEIAKPFQPGPNPVETAVSETDGTTQEVKAA
ncbi:MAG: hypothetical protein QOH06_2350 [Acidobacteriota bacterium]|jgi:hypothetical protein|nr:hypothetical protein [Acidobacteriota bacterium]